MGAKMIIIVKCAFPWICVGVGVCVNAKAYINKRKGRKKTLCLSWCYGRNIKER